MSRRDEQRGDVGPGPEDGADGLALVRPAGSDRPDSGPGSTYLAAEPALGAADGRQVEPEAQVAGDPQPTGMGDPLAVAEDHVGAGLQPVEGFEERGGLAEREQPRARRGTSPGEARPTPLDRPRRCRRRTTTTAAKRTSEPRSNETSAAARVRQAGSVEEVSTALANSPWRDLASPGRQVPGMIKRHGPARPLGGWPRRRGGPGFLRDVQVGASPDHLRPQGAHEHAGLLEPPGDLLGRADRAESTLIQTKFVLTGPDSSVRAPGVSSTALAKHGGRSGGPRPADPPDDRCAWRAPAAMTPAWRIPPPSTLRSRWASWIASSRADQGRADRRAEALREADRDRVEVASPLGGRDAAGHDGVHQAGAIEVHRQPVGPGPSGNLGDRGDRVDLPAPHGCGYSPGETRRVWA